MDSSFTRDLEKPGKSEEPREGKKMRNNNQQRHIRKIQLRYVTEEMLEMYRKMSEEEEMFKRQYEEAAYKVYGTLPAEKASFNTEPKESEIHKD